MINNLSLDAVRKSIFHNEMLMPLYDSYCFSKIPDTITSLFAGDVRGLPRDCLPKNTQDIKNVVLLFVDALGWNILHKTLEHPDSKALKNLIDGGVLSKITSMFPATTAAHATTLYTGLTPGLSGIFEWYQYASGVGRAIRPLQACVASSHQPGQLLTLGYPVESYCQPSTYFESLKQHGVESLCYFAPYIANSPVNSVLCHGAERRSFKTIASGLKEVSTLIDSDDQRRYISFYFDGVDHLAHVNGPYAEATIKVALKFWRAFEENLLPALEHSKNTMLLVIADHGQTTVDPEKLIKLESYCPQLIAMQRNDVTGEAVYPGGSLRDLFLYLRPECVAEGIGLARELFADVADVFSATELMDRGLFGPVTDRLRANMGDLVILPKAPTPIFWSGPDDRFVKGYKGHHGGLNREEAETIFIATRF